jgi:hypothetical protein
MKDRAENKIRAVFKARTVKEQAAKAERVESDTPVRSVVGKSF